MNDWRKQSEKREVAWCMAIFAGLLILLLVLFSAPARSSETTGNITTDSQTGGKGSHP